ncbi:unnamed protein product [Rotaria sp. Silwood1]|nr:unnamed protein product [Rotaria sp. Silwood1]CAF4583706.1 unnamed protein product [Rotaria sp. Silwood1]CAF4718276.1 unnamed protein product [Rotaria sp. Silwood1]CAF4737582.1 unnamed protein product [Rotaria sp. Silwood1]
MKTTLWMSMWGVAVAVSMWAKKRANDGLISNEIFVYRGLDYYGCEMARLIENTPNFQHTVSAKIILPAIEYVERLDENQNNQTDILLKGTLISIKDQINQKYVDSSMGMTMRNFRSALKDKLIIQFIKQQDTLAVFVRTATIQSMMLPDIGGENCRVAVNPFDRTHTRGGSSGVLISSRECPIGIGRDIGGSIRIVAYFCSVFGFKPTPGCLTGKDLAVPSLKNEMSEKRRVINIRSIVGPLARCTDDNVLIMRSFLQANICRQFLESLDNEAINPLYMPLFQATTLPNFPRLFMACLMRIFGERCNVHIVQSIHSKTTYEYFHLLTLDRFSSGLAIVYPFINDIIERALVIINHDQFQQQVLNELCAQVVKSRTKDCNELQQFVKERCTQLKLQVCVDTIKVPNVLMQCAVFKYNESQPCQIFISILKTRTSNKSTKEIGDMGYGGEEILLGGRLFPILDNSSDKDFKIIGLRLDVHEKSSIASSKYTVDLNFIDTLFDIDKLKAINDLSQLTIKLDNPLEANRQTKTICHTGPIRSKRPKLRRADSDSSLLSTSLSSSTSIDSEDLHNIDPNDPNVMYPPYYLPPPGFIPRSPNSITSEDDDDDTEVRINGMPPNRRVRLMIFP